MRAAFCLRTAFVASRAPARARALCVGARGRSMSAAPVDTATSRLSSSGSVLSGGDFAPEDAGSPGRPAHTDRGVGERFDRTVPAWPVETAAVGSAGNSLEPGRTRSISEWSNSTDGGRLGAAPRRTGYGARA